MKKIAFLASAVAVCLVATTAQAATVTFGTPTSRAVSAGESGATNPAPSGGSVNEFFVTTDADILSVYNVAITGGTLYQHPTGTNTGPADPAFVAVFPSLGADSYIDTPGAAAILGVDMPGDGTENSAWGDTSDNGAQQNFKFAQLTFPQGSNWLFRGTVSVSGATGPENFNFSFAIPEPASFGLASMGLLALAGLRRRFA